MNKKLLLTLVACILPLVGCGGDRESSKPTNTDGGESSVPTGPSQIDDVTGDGDHYGGVEQSGTIGLTYALQDVYMKDPETGEMTWKTGYKVTGYVGSSSKVEIPATFNDKPVYQISARAFQNNLVMESVRLGKNIVSIKEFAFARTYNLKRIEIDNDNTYFTQEEGLVYHIEKNEDGEETRRVLYFGEAGRYLSFDAPKMKITAMAMGCFGNQENLMYLRVNLDQIASDGSYRRLCHLFNDSNNGSPRYYIDKMKNDYVPHLASLVIAGGGRVDRNFAYQCYSLTSVIFEEGVNFIDAYAFSGCVRLQTAEVSGSVTYIQDYAFSSCKDLYKMWIARPSSTMNLEVRIWSGCRKEAVIFHRGAQADYKIYGDSTYYVENTTSIGTLYSKTYSEYEARVAKWEFSPIPADPVEEAA